MKKLEGSLSKNSVSVAVKKESSSSISSLLSDNQAWEGMKGGAHAMLMVVGEVIKRESFELFCVLELVLATKLRKQEGGGGLARRWRRKEREREIGTVLASPMSGLVRWIKHVATVHIEQA
ncbi:Os02g0317900 [Oryza sativa Japonica Group]|uniref:Os02g0317900 protein n=1 Tax=Oryza sativa subsp. japonica TaxID=39947 RepID=A0A0P0VI93_ORYSJ|nr:Os02g0317900 [Oryza sativa Japonica Group]